MRRRRAVNEAVLILIAVTLAGSLSCADLNSLGGGPGQARAAAPVAMAPPAAPYTGLKKRIAVAKFTFGASRRWSDNIVEFGSGMADMLTTELQQTGRFIVVERKELNSVLTEQDLGASGRVSKATAAKVGQLLGAQYLVVGIISEFEEKSSQTGGGLGGRIGTVGVLLGGGKTSAHIGIDLRLVDSTTGAIVQAHKAVGKQTGFGIAGGLSYKGFAAGGGHRQKTAVGRAVRQILTQMVGYIVRDMEAVPWQARVAAVRGDKTYINAGANMNVGAGAMFEVTGEPITDPETGAVIAAGETVAKIQVVKVLPKAAICTLLEGEKPETGAIVQAAADYQPPVPAPAVAPATDDPSQPPPATGEKFCPTCGRKMPKGTKFCPYDGTKIP